MMCEIQGDLEMPYLRAIQAVPGNTASEKLSWIGRLTSNSASGDSEQLPQELLPLLKVEIAVKEKKHDDITTALKSEDWMIVNRAFKAIWFFDGSHKDTVNAHYFCEYIFPHVSMNTRVRIINTLANRLTDPELAKQLFTKITSIYGFSNAYPLILACDEEFVYRTIQQRKFVLPVGTAKKFFRKNPDLIVRYLKLLKPVKATERAPFPLDINKYKSLLPKLVKKRLEAFAELFEMHERNPPKFTLSNTCTEIFLKKGQQYLNKKPYLYINILPLKKINEEIMESIFEGLLPVKSSCFETDKILKYLQYYPKNKRYDLLRKCYMAKYNTELLDEDKNITPALLQILPAEERIKQARIMLEKEKLEETQFNDTMDYEKAWICYLPINEAIPIIKEKINKTSFDLNRANLICQMFYACKVNEDDDALIDTLIYFKNRHKNEEHWIFERIMEQFLMIHDIPHLNAKQNSLLFDIVQLFHVKNGYITEGIAKAMIHFRLIHDMPIDDLIRMLVDTNNNRWSINFNIFKEHPQYNRKCLVIFANIIQETFFKKHEYINNQYHTLCRFIIAMYEFNNICKKSHIKIELMRVKDYPWILDTIQLIRADEISKDMVMRMLKKEEPELYCSISSTGIIADVTSGEALALLKRNPEDILNNWKRYFADCKKKHYSNEVQRFIRATRWYQDIPIKFVERCMSFLREIKDEQYFMFVDTNDILPILTILAILLHGNTLTKIVESLIPAKTTIDATHSESRENYKLVRHLPFIMRLSNPPVPLELVAKLCEGDYLSIALRALTNVSRRSCLPKVLLFAHNLYDMRVGARKHGVRLMYQIAPMNELTAFLQQMWNTESHHSIREIIFNMVQKLFCAEPNPDNWFLYCSVIHTMQIKDEPLLLQIKLFPSIPDQYVEKYFETWLETINDFELKSNAEGTNKYLISFLQEITVPVCNILSDKFAQNIITKYLFDINADLSKAARNFSMLYLFPENEDKFKDRSKKFIDTFYSIVKIHWNKTHPTKLRFYPYNNAVHLFVEDFVIVYVKRFCLNKSTNTQFIDDMLKLYSSILIPTQDARSYLLLTYAKKLQECISTNKCFGLYIGQYVLKLVKIFSSVLVQFMAKILDHFLNRVFKDHNNLEELKLNIIEGLVKADNIHSCFMAAVMLSPVTLKKLGIRYDELITKFREMENPAITSVLNDHLNMLDFQSVISD